jgi:hypothetical protein
MTALSPIVHNSDERAGNMAFARMVGIVDPNGNPVEVPVVSGNSLRGQLRRIAARRLLRACGVEKVPLPMYHLLFSGGSIEKGATKIAYSVEDIKALRRRIPFLGLFGGAFRNDVFPSTLRVEFIWPVCRETSEITGVVSPRYARELLDTVFYTRRDDGYEEVAPVKVAEKSTQMIYEVEAIVPGVELVGGVGLYYARELEASCLADTFAEWMGNPRLGGKSAVGHGKVKIVDMPALPSPVLYQEYIRDNAAHLGDFLRSGGDLLKETTSISPEPIDFFQAVDDLGTSCREINPDDLRTF